MDDEKRFLILSLNGESYAISITRLVEISALRQIQKDKNLSEFFEGKMEYRGKMIPVINLRKVFKLPLEGGGALLILKSSKGNLGILVDAVSEITAADHSPAPLPAGLMNPGIKYYRGVLRHGERLLVLLRDASHVHLLLPIQFLLRERRIQEHVGHEGIALVEMLFQDIERHRHAVER